MPEMPEVQAQAERMSSALVGRSLERFQLLNFAGLKTFAPPADGAVGAAVTGVGRRGKYLLLGFDNGHTHIVHLMQGGRWRSDPKRSAKPRGGIARWIFEDDQAWLLTEAGTERKAGIWAVDGDPIGQEPLVGLGPEATSLSLDEFGSILAANSGRVHGVLRSQKALSGLGRMLTNEVLFDAGLSPFANAAKLGPDEVARLHASIVSIAESALEHERTLDDIGSSADRPSRVHNRAGQPCLDEGCGEKIATVEYRAYTVFYCPARQTGGKLLADNTTSKFLR